jgi:hypothetical protein
LHRQQQADGIKGAYLFINERGKPFGRMGVARMIERAGEQCMSTCCGIGPDMHWRPAEWTHTAAPALPGASRRPNDKLVISVNGANVKFWNVA